MGDRQFEGILPKEPYLPCVSMAGRALLAGYHPHKLNNVIIIIIIIIIIIVFIAGFHNMYSDIHGSHI